MKPFHTVAIPHRDILEGRSAMDVFAADLWNAYKGEGIDEYKNYDLFFRKTYITEGLKNLLDIVKKRIEGRLGDSIIQLQTPFGGGKTHSLIALMHKAKVDWKINLAVIVGTNLDAKEETLWGLLEKELTGRNEIMTGQISPGKEKIRSILEKNQPLLILMDEVLEYVTKSAGVKVGNSTLSAQTIAFMQELTEVVATLEKACLVVTLPSSTIEHYDTEAERLFSQLQKVVGRVERIYTPVQDHEIAKIIRKRLFIDIDEEEVKNIVDKFINYAEKEKILPIGLEPTEYRDRFIDSYPFMPDVIDVLYHRWGSFPNFQRTRGVLRLLSLVVSSLKYSNIPYITLSDFDLSNEDIRFELVKYIGEEYNSVIAQDITRKDSGSRRVDDDLGISYRGLKLGTRSATSIFMYSFSGGREKGATILEIKRSATTLNNPSSVINEALDLLKNRLFYLQYQNDKYFFSNQPNLNRILVLKAENIREEEIEEYEKELIKKNVRSEKLKVYVWEEKSENIPDNEEFKLIILKEEKEELINKIIKFKGEIPRVNVNSLFLLIPIESERLALKNTIRNYLAYEYIKNDKNLNLSNEQKREIEINLRNLKESLEDQLRRAYRNIVIPGKNEKEDLGIPTVGEKRTLDILVYETLKSNGYILETIDPKVIKEKFLGNNDYVFTKQIINSSYRTPGALRFASKEVLIDGIKKAVKNEILGIGELREGKIILSYYGKEKTPEVSFEEEEILINKEICEKLIKETKLEGRSETFLEIKKEDIKMSQETRIITEEAEKLPNSHQQNYRESVKLKFEIPEGKTSGIIGVIRFLREKFNKVEIEIKATQGKITQNEYEKNIKEAFSQLEIDVEED
ncbi:MAG: DUF499 domain-containing protein [Dictyoglomus sp.]|nr:DUF499 domain-containing protein [Dictyoglomus sp.]MDW8189253.1 DUF499 domain-containing protein [Dictyoglomus sp.]